MERSLERAYRRLSQRVSVPGFRKGKTPRPMLERHVGRQRLVQEALDILIPEAYNQALDEQDIEPIGQPSIELVQEEPLSFKATVPIRPTVELGDYRTLRIQRYPVTVDPIEVDATLEELRRRYALWEPVERPVQMGDSIRAEVHGTIEGREVTDDTDAEIELREGTTIVAPGFIEALVGAEKGVPKEITVTMAPGSQYEGKEATFNITVKEIKEERVPDLDDEFARQVGEGFSSLQGLREELTKNMEERRKAEAEEEYRQEAVVALEQQAEKVEFPPVMVDREIDRLLRDSARETGQDLDRYLQMLRRTEDELRQELRPGATERVRRSLALSRLAEMEDIRVEPEDVDREIDKLAASAGAQAEQMRQIFSGPDAREAIARSLHSRKTLDRLAEIVSQEPIEESEGQEEAPAAADTALGSATDTGTEAKIETEVEK